MTTLVLIHNNIHLHTIKNEVYELLINMTRKINKHVFGLDILINKIISSSLKFSFLLRNYYIINDKI